LTAAIGAIGLLVIALIAGAKRVRTSARDEVDDNRPGTVPGRSNFPGALGSAAPRLIPKTPEEIEQEVAALMRTWRDSVIQRDADAVVKLDGIFRAEPARYASALAKSAQSDPDAHVRAFSTRVLGKLAQPDYADVLGQLLSDQSSYVRQNAAWALGELGRAVNGQIAATPALAALRRARARDPDGNVRSAARVALDHLE
jgi:HEAT repeat protein